MRVLLSGFEPFGGAATNCTGMIVDRLASSGIDGVDLHTLVLPVVDGVGPEMLTAAVRDLRPDAVIAMGEAEHRDAVSVERLAVNIRDFRIPDNAGNQPRGRPVVPGGPYRYGATLPFESVRGAIRAVGVPAELSDDCGLFLCNQVSYVLLHAVHGRVCGSRRMACGFLHVPLVHEQGGERPRESAIPLERMCTGISAAVRVVGRAADRA